MIYLNNRPVPGFGHGAAVEGRLGFWPWDTSKWRYFFGMESGRVVNRAGPLWLSDAEAESRSADIMDRGLAQGRSISPLRYDWDESAGQWRPV